ncbi:hypothetical protein BDR05DRAFT_1004857 [Suillus weaverae]|nr:hypothetical protein BDR05DRAFT_1004857 [Suillus weaverae]
MSRRTVSRALIEGGVATSIQLGHEISQANGLTISGDGTTHKNVNYELRIIELKTPSYTAASPQKHHARVISVSSSINHTSETQISGWKEEISHLSSTFSQSPFAKCSGLSLDIDSFLKKLKGMHTDHASDQKKTCRLWKEWKHRVICASYGFEHIEKMKCDAPIDLCAILLQATQEIINSLGGSKKWDALDVDSCRPYVTEMMEGLALRFSEGILAALPDEEHRSVELFFWAGCSMHKELNSVKGGNVAMMKWWVDNGVPTPVLLANKDNAATIQLAEMVDASAAAVRRAFEVSSRGGVKVASIAGALFNHKDDKKGNVKGALKKFPDTSNTRYHSHCDAATELIKYLKHYLDFLDFIRSNKTNAHLNHMEENLDKALRDTATLVELAALTLYSQLIMKPYMCLVRAPGTEDLNVLDLGPLHDDLKNHIKTIINQPSVIFNFHPDSYLCAAFDKKPWDDLLAIQAIIDMHNAGTLPHLIEVFVAFLGGALETWERFTEEFAAGGLIASSSAEERQLAAMPTTNDANEGMLGMWRRHSRDKPSLTVGHFSNQAAFARNETQDFMNALFVDEDHAHIRKEARRIDASGIEKHRRDAVIQYKKTVAEENHKKEEEHHAKKASVAEYFSVLEIVVDGALLNTMLDQSIKDQLELHRCLGEEKTIPKKTHLSSKHARLQVLLLVVDRYEARRRGESLDDEVNFLDLINS